MSDRIQRYDAFWPYYLGEHRRPRTRALHYFGSLGGVAIALAAIATGHWWLLVPALVAGYLFAWIGHAFVERNRPATFTYPLWSFVSDFRMLWFWLTGRLDGEMERHGIR